MVPMTALPSKLALKNELVAQLEAQLATLERAYAASREAATHDEAKPENDKDTRALEQSYIARGQALRVEEMRACVVDVKALPAHPSRLDLPPESARCSHSKKTKRAWWSTWRPMVEGALSPRGPCKWLPPNRR